MNRLINYVKDTKAELRHVSWPTRQQSIVFSVLVIAVSIIVALYLGFLDFVFKWVLDNFLL